MSDYLQPEFYRFNQDSLFLVNWIEKKGWRPKHVLDFGAGSGVIGIELSNRLAPESLTLVELQPEFAPYIRSNLETQKQGSYSSDFFISSFGDWKSDSHFDLIVSNPPYYLPGQGEASKDQRKGRARSFLIDDWRVLLARIAFFLTPEGKALLVIKNDKNILQHIRKEVRGVLELMEHLEGDVVVLELTRLNKNGNHELS